MAPPDVATACCVIIVFNELLFFEFGHFIGSLAIFFLFLSFSFSLSHLVIKFSFLESLTFEMCEK